MPRRPPKRGLEEIAHLFVSGDAAPPAGPPAAHTSIGREVVIAVACDPGVAQPLRSGLKLTRRLDTGGAAKTFVCPFPDEDEAPAIGSLLPRGAEPPPLDAERPCSIEANGSLRLLLTPGSRTSMSTPPAVPAASGPVSDAVVVVFLKGTSAPHWREALRWCDAFVMVLPGETAALARYQTFLDTVRETTGRVFWAPAADLDTEAIQAIQATWRMIPTVCRLDSTRQVPHSPSTGRDALLSWARFLSRHAS